jgi:Asp-tRNA(Asn)/Glu-tRNA(Gln) amidotransferase A subunit family amidase
MLAELAQSVRAGRVSAVELIEESLRRIEAAADLNAVVRVEADQALAAAEAHDRQGALAGIPLLVKDLSRAAGSVTTNGSRLYAGAEPDEVDDITVARLRAAGAIVVGRTNSPEFGHTLFTHNELHGTTVNPWNHEFSPGGSSGGSAAALIAGLAPMATTSDGGGSVRIPAAACGLLGMKPTMGVVGRNHLPRWIEFSTQGATGRSVADVVASLGIAAVGEDELIALCKELIAANPKIVADVQSGKEQAAAGLIGQAKKKNPNVNPAKVRQTCVDLIKALG